MKVAWVVVLACVVGCAEIRQFDVNAPSEVTATPTQPYDAVGRTHQPYQGKPKYLAAARPLLPTTSGPVAENPCANRSARCDERLRATLAAVDGQLLALSRPPTDLQLQALRLSLAELMPLTEGYPDLAAERDELRALVDKLPTLSEIDQGTARKRMQELSDLIRIQIAAAQ